MQTYSQPLSNGFILHETEAAPGAGVNIVHNFPAGTTLELQDIHFTLVTDATVVNRFLVIQIKDAGTIIATFHHELAMVASQTYLIHAYPNAPFQTTSSINIRAVTLPSRYVIPGNFTLNTAINSLQAGDVISASEFTYKRWINQTI